MFLALSISLVLSIVLNGFLLFAYFSIKSGNKNLNVSAKDMLHDLTVRGHSLVRVEVIDPDGLLLWRGKR